MAMSTATGGPILTPEQVHSLVIQPLIDQSVAAQVSTIVTTGSHDLRVPRVTADPAAAWTAEGQKYRSPMRPSMKSRSHQKSWLA